jgi:hypothetical protein
MTPPARHSRHRRHELTTPTCASGRSGWTHPTDDAFLRDLYGRLTLPALKER